MDNDKPAQGQTLTDDAINAEHDAWREAVKMWSSRHAFMAGAKFGRASRDGEVEILQRKYDVMAQVYPLTCQDMRRFQQKMVDAEADRDRLTAELTSAYDRLEQRTCIMCDEWEGYKAEKVTLTARVKELEHAYLKGQERMRERAAQEADNCHGEASTCGDSIAALPLEVKE